VNENKTISKLKYRFNTLFKTVVLQTSTNALQIRTSVSRDVQTQMGPMYVTVPVDMNFYQMGIDVQVGCVVYIVFDILLNHLNARDVNVMLAYVNSFGIHV